MGANIGTCIDGIMAALVSNAKGKRIALFHVITSVIGAVMFSIILVIFRTPMSAFLKACSRGTPVQSGNLQPDI